MTTDEYERKHPVVFTRFTHKDNGDGEYVRAKHIKDDIYQLDDFSRSLEPDETCLYPPRAYVRLRQEDPHGTGGYMVIVEQVAKP
jgi:hypothetical protein